MRGYLLTSHIWMLKNYKEIQEANLILITWNFSQIFISTVIRVIFFHTILYFLSILPFKTYLRKRRRRNHVTKNLHALLLCRIYFRFTILVFLHPLIIQYLLYTWIWRYKCLVVKMECFQNPSDKKNYIIIPTIRYCFYVWS